jgi:hypothetical protein
MKRSNVLITVLLSLGIVSLLLDTEGASAEAKFRYTKDECVKCHAVEVNDIATAGKKHRSVPCVGCHVGHPPEVKKPIAPCNKCHPKAKKAHFVEGGGCLNCHTKPHTPLKITFRDKTDCLYCHRLQIDQLMEGKSKHSALDCTVCHDVHRKIPQCTQCHKPHWSEQSAADCKQCHKPHAPRFVAFPAGFPVPSCAKCHKKPADLLSANTTKHNLLECTTCHQGKHRTIPTCQSCHGSPHAAGIMRKFPKCGSCHNIAHALNDWSATEALETPAQAQQKKTSELPAR